MDDTIRQLLAATHLVAGGTDPESGAPFLLAFTPDHPHGRPVEGPREALEVIRAVGAHKRTRFGSSEPAVGDVSGPR